MDQDGTMEFVQYPVTSREQAWSIKDVLYGTNITVFCRERAGNPGRGRYHQKSPLR